MAGTERNRRGMSELAETAVLEAMRVYANAFSVTPDSEPAYGSEDAIRIRRHFRTCVRDWATAMRTDKVPAERVIILLKQMMLEHLGSPDQHAGIAEQAVVWSIVAYYDRDRSPQPDGARVQATISGLQGAGREL